MAADTCGRFSGACEGLLLDAVLSEPVTAIWLKCAVAVALGALVGAQREFAYVVGASLARSTFASRPVRRAGLRTHMLVALGAALFSEASWAAFSTPVPALYDQTNFVAGTFNYDTSRVAAQIVSGIGFLGAGTISKERGRLTGLTTAASLWATAAIGLHVGGSNQHRGYFLVPVGATLLIVFTLQLVIHVEQFLHRLASAKTVSCVEFSVSASIDGGFSEARRTLEELVDAVEGTGSCVSKCGYDVREASLSATLDAVLPPGVSSLDVLGALAGLPALLSVATPAPTAAFRSPTGGPKRSGEGSVSEPLLRTSCYPLVPDQHCFDD